MRQFLRSLLGRLLGPAVFTRRLPKTVGGGRICVSVRAGMSWLRPDVFRRDPALIDLARLFVPRGGVAWDVGANVGLFAFAAAGVARRDGFVAAFEPEVSCLPLLDRSRAMQDESRARVEIFPVAISNRAGVHEFCVAPGCTAVSHLDGAGDPAFDGQTAEKRMVMTARLDDFLGKIPSPSAIKIDVEGHEVAALDGARELVRSARPVILVEVLCGSHDPVRSYFRGMDYQLFEFSRGLGGCQRIEGPIWNTLAVPRERLPKFPFLP